MTGAATPQLAEIRRADIVGVAAFLHTHLNPRVSTDDWAAALVPRWAGTPPNHGYQLRVGDDIVGVYAALYSERLVDGVVERFCNLAAWCVREEYRAHGLRMLRALLAQPGYHFTDLSPSGNVVALNSRLRFRALDTTTALVPNLPAAGRGTTVLTRPARIRQVLTGRDLEIYLDHQTARAARHVVLVRGDEHCYVIYRRDRRRGLPLFASLLHVGDPALLARATGALGSHLLRQGIPFTLAELRLLGEAPRLSRTLGTARPKMIRTPLPDDAIDYLYSELTCVAW